MMKCVLLLVVLGTYGAAGQDSVWLELMTAQIRLAEDVKVTADRNLPQLAGDLGLNTLVSLVQKANLVDALSGTGNSSVHLCSSTSDAGKFTDSRPIVLKKYCVTPYIVLPVHAMIMLFTWALL